MITLTLREILTALTKDLKKWRIQDEAEAEAKEQKKRGEVFGE
jgi:hypothetical protein